MKNKSTYISLILLITSAVINGSDCDEPEERVSVPYPSLYGVRKSPLCLYQERVAYFGVQYCDSKETTLLSAVATNDLKTVQQLIQSGTNLEIGFPATPLLRAACLGCQLPIMQALINAGASVNVDKGSSLLGTPLGNAVRMNRLEHVNILLAAGANPEGEHLGETFLEIAIKSNQEEITKKLIEAGAKPDTKALCLAVLNDNLKMIKMLEEAGVKVSISVLSSASKKNNPEVMAYLRQKRALYWQESGCSVQ